MYLFLLGDIVLVTKNIPRKYGWWLVLPGSCSLRLLLKVLVTKKLWVLILHSSSSGIRRIWWNSPEFSL